MPNFCPTCGKPLQFENAEICPNCGVRAPPPPSEIRDRFLAVVFSFFFPGWGQWYNGKTWDGLNFFAAFLGTYFLIIYLFIFSIIGLDQALFTIFILILTVVIIGIWIYGMYDAYKTADKINKRKESFSRKSRLFWLPPAWLAFMILAAVVSYVLLGSGFFTTQKAQETVYEGVEQSTANIQMIGNVYGQSSNPSAGIDEIKFSIGLAPGAPAIDLTKMKIVFSTPSTNPIILTQGSTASNSVFTTKLNGDTPVSSLNLYQQVEIVFKTAPINANSKTNIELRPDVGDALPFSKTAPATIAATNVLY